MTIRRSYRRLVACALAAGFMAAPATVFASDRAWTSSGNTGIVDDSNQAQVFLDVQRARLAGGVQSATIRYNVTATEGLFAGPTKKLTVRFYKPDVFTFVNARLWYEEIATGAMGTLLFFDSSLFAPNAAIQTQSVSMNLVNDFDFGKKVYWVEVGLFRSTGPNGVLLGDPRIDLLQIDTQ